MNQDAVEKSTYQGFSTNHARIGGFSLSGSGSTDHDTVEKTAHPGFSFLRYNKYFLYSTRIATFNSWLKSMPITAKELAHASFIYTRYADKETVPGVVLP